MRKEEILKKNMSKKYCSGTRYSYLDPEEIEMIACAMQEFSQESNKELLSELEQIKERERQYYELWNPVDEYVRNLPSCQVGDSVSKKTLELLSKIEELEKSKAEIVGDRIHWRQEANRLNDLYCHGNDRVQELSEQLSQSQQMNERLLSGNDKEISYASMVFRNVQTASKVEIILKPKHMNDVYTWKQIQDAILTDNDKIPLQSTTQEKGEEG